MSPLIKQLRNIQTGATTWFGSYMTIDEFKKFKEIVTQYFEYMDSEQHDKDFEYQ